ncbi:unnamed protein product [Hymenolepis diminuta]|uniref:Uncharacterized protein n=1 Tax=Hymenolepis diminuta TaxID=6216 RepID=A0A564YK04_HYMDI|nr:unnamed protein product [Hymenolepis diminuta]
MPGQVYRFSFFFYNCPVSFKSTSAHIPHARLCPSDLYKLPLYFHTRARHAFCTPALRCPLIIFFLYLSLTHLNPRFGLINTFWPKQLLVFCSKTVVVARF